MTKRSRSTNESPTVNPTPKKKSNQGDENDAGSALADTLTQIFLCPITQELMVDPVTAEDGNTYERSAIEKWLSTKDTSPLNPGQRLKVKNLLPARQIRISIEKMIESGDVDEDLSTVWKEKKKVIDLAKAKKLFKEGSVMDAAKLGLPAAQGRVAHWYYNGTNGVEKDYDKRFMFAKKAAEGGDRNGQFLLGYAYSNGEGVDRDDSTAILWYEKAAEQGCSDSMHNLGTFYEFIGCQLDHNFLQRAAAWYRKGANAGCHRSMFKVGKFYYDGSGVLKDHKEARA